MPVPSNQIQRYVFRRARRSPAGLVTWEDTCCDVYDSRLDLWPDPINPNRCLPVGVPTITLPVDSGYTTGGPLFRASIDNPVNHVSVYLTNTKGGNLADISFGLQLRVGLPFIEDRITEVINAPKPSTGDWGGFLFSVTLPRLYTSIALTGRSDDTKTTTPYSVDVVLLLDRRYSAATLVDYGEYSAADV